MNPAILSTALVIAGVLPSLTKVGVSFAEEDDSVLPPPVPTSTVTRASPGASFVGDDAMDGELLQNLDVAENLDLFLKFDVAGLLPALDGEEP